MKYSDALKDTAKQVLWLAPTESYLYSEMAHHTKELLWAIFCFVVRMLMLAMFPVSIPLLAIAHKKDVERSEQSRKRAIESIRDYYRNIRVYGD